MHSSLAGQYGGQAAVDTVFKYTQMDDDNFAVVDTSRPFKPTYARGRRPFQNRVAHQLARERRNERQGIKEDDTKKPVAAPRSRWQKTAQARWNNMNYNDRPAIRVRDSSVDVRPEWTVIEQINISQFSKLQLAVPEPEELKECGGVQYYDKTYDSITSKSNKVLERFDSKVFHRVTTSDDPNMKALAAAGAGNVFATDAIISLLMSCPRSVYSWDIVVTRKGDQVFLDKRDGTWVDYVSVNETASEAPPDERDVFNSASMLSEEATFINQNFSQQCLQKPDTQAKKMCKEPNPFAGVSDDAASVMYRYRKFPVTKDINLVIRAEVDAVHMVKEKEEYITIRALNEYDPKAVQAVDWRQKIDGQRGAVLATELKNNSNKLARWTSTALLAGSSLIKIGYVSRNNPRDAFNHVILGTQFYKPKEFATQINLNVNNAWGIIKHISDMVLKYDEGKYVLLKDPNKPVLRMYKVPVDAKLTSTPVVGPAAQ